MGGRTRRVLTAAALTDRMAPWRGHKAAGELAANPGSSDDFILFAPLQNGRRRSARSHRRARRRRRRQPRRGVLIPARVLARACPRSAPCTVNARWIEYSLGVRRCS